MGGGRSPKAPAHPLLPGDHKEKRLDQAAPRSRHRHAAHLAVLLGILLLVQVPRLGGHLAALASPVFPPHRGYSDFDWAYYPAGQAIRHDPAQLYQGAAYDAATHRLQISAPAYFVNIPLVAWLFVPFTIVSRSSAGAVLLLINVVIVLACLALLLRRLPNERPAVAWALTLAFATSGPLLYALNLGQTTPLVLLLLLLAENSLHHGHKIRAGAWLGLACLIKVPPLLLLPYLALRRRWRVAAASGAVLAAAVGLSISCYGWPLHVRFFDVAIRANAGTAIAAHNCQSLDAFLARLFTSASSRSWRPIVLPPWVRLTKWLLLGALLAVCAWTFRRPGPITERRQRLELGAVLCAALIAAPISWAHYGMWLLPVFLIAGDGVLQTRSAPARAILAGALVAAVLCVNLPVLPGTYVGRFGNNPWFRIAISHELFGTMILLGLCLWGIREMTLARVGKART